MGINQYTDREIVNAILQRHTTITKEYLYRRCYPMFRSLYSKYHTDCENVVEFINEIYVYILTPPPNTTNRCKLAEFNFGCSLTTWLRVVAKNYCHQLFRRKADVDFCALDCENIAEAYSMEIDANTFNMDDLNKVVKRMPNARYRRLIELRYLEGKTVEETANILGTSMTNYYNMHLCAKTQIRTLLRKEELL